MKYFVSLIVFIIAGPSLWAGLFSLTDSAPPVLPDYGVNASIEPTFSQVDKVLYEKVSPYLRENPQYAIELVNAELTQESNPAFYFLLGNLYYQIGSYEYAQSSLKQALAAMPSFRRAYRTLGLIYIRREVFGEAVDVWRKVITLGGGDGQSYGLLAYALLTQKQYASALSAYEQARMFAPESLDFKRGLAQCLLATKQYKRAVAFFDELIETHPHEKDFWLLQANAFLALEMHEEALANLVVAVKLGDIRAQTWQLLGDLYLSEGMATHALESYLAMLSGEGSLDALHMVRPLDALIARRHLLQARRYYSALNVALNAQDRLVIKTPLTLAQGVLLIDEGRAREAVEVLRPIADAQPLKGDVLLLLAQAYREGDNFEQAYFYYERAALLPEHQAQAWLELGRMFIHQGAFEKALGYLIKAQNSQPREDVARIIEQVEHALKR